MIDRSALPAISTILSRLDISPGRRGRTRCPIHRGENSQSFSYEDEKGSWYCFRCGFGGDAVTLIEKTLDCDFKGALRWFGIEPGIPPKPDPEILRRQKARAGLRAWTKKVGKVWRDEFLTRERLITRALALLREDPEDSQAWEWLSWALTGHAALEYKLDMIAGKEDQQIEVFRYWRAA
jgi:DNA primase